MLELLAALHARLPEHWVLDLTSEADPEGLEPELRAEAEGSGWYAGVDVRIDGGKWFVYTYRNGRPDVAGLADACVAQRLAELASAGVRDGESAMLDAPREE
jgi:hypothetical protein